MSGFRFNGIHSKNKYITAISAPRIIVPERKTEIVDIPYRSTGYVIPDESYKSEILPITCWTDKQGKSIYEIGREWVRWLHTSTWANLVFDDDPSVTYKAMCITKITTDDLQSPIITIEFIYTWGDDHL